MLEALGELALAESPSTDVNLFPTGITSGEAIGAAEVYPEGTIAHAGAIASAQAFGTPAIVHLVTGIAPAEAFGTPSIGEYRVYQPVSKL